MATDNLSVATPSKAWTDQAQRWKLISTLLEGTDALQAARETYLPRYKHEEPEAYERRLKSSHFYNYLELTLEHMVSMVFAKPVALSQDGDPRLQLIAENANRQGDHLSVVVRNWFMDALAKGHSHMLIDYPSVRGPVRRDQELQTRPYFVHIPPENLLAAYADYQDGTERIIHARILEPVVVREGWTERLVNRIRVLEPGSFQLWEERSERGKTSWVRIDEGPLTMPEVPLVTFYAQRKGFMRSKPPLLSLAYANLTHWRSSTEQRNILSVARFPILTATGLSSREADGQVLIGPNQLLLSSNPDAEFAYVEHSGAAIGSGRQDLEDLKAEMATMGADLITRRPGNMTATGAAIDNGKESSALESMAFRMVDSVERALVFAARWMGIREERTPSATIHSNFDAVTISAPELQALERAWGQGAITTKTYLSELKRYGVLADAFDVDAELELLRVEGPAAGDFGDPDPGGEE